MGEAGADWFVLLGDQQEGPLTFEALDECCRAGLLDRTSYVWRTGLEDWVEAKTLPELAGLLPPEGRALSVRNVLNGDPATHIIPAPRSGRLNRLRAPPVLSLEELPENGQHGSRPWLRRLEPRPRAPGLLARFRKLLSS